MSIQLQATSLPMGHTASQVPLMGLFFGHGREESHYSHDTSLSNPMLTFDPQLTL